MNTKNLIFFVLLAIFSNSCSGEQAQSSKTKLAPTDFAERMRSFPSAPIIDVRTPAEFAKGHLINAKNIDWNGEAFDQQISSIDKSGPVLVYCLSGARSAAAASKMRASGYKEVYELQGGIMKWNGANLPTTTTSAPTTLGMSKEQFDVLLASDKPVLVDFYADWCAPCKQMKPFFEEITRDMGDKVVVFRINVDNHPLLCKELKISDLPVIQLYINKSLLWSNSGFMDKDMMVARITSER